MKSLFTKPADLLLWNPREHNNREGNCNVLHIAFERGDIEILKHLLELSPKHFMQLLTMGDCPYSVEWEAPLERAIRFRHHSIVRWMCETGIMTQTVFNTCCAAREDKGSALNCFKFDRVNIWTDAGIDWLIQVEILEAPGIPGKRAKEDGEAYFEGVVAGSQFLMNHTCVMMEGDMNTMHMCGRIVEAPMSTQFQREREKSEIESLLEEWQALPNTEKRHRTLSMFSDLIWPAKRIISISAASPADSARTKITCQGLSGDTLATIEINLQEELPPQIRSKIAEALGEPTYSLRILLPSGKLLDECAPTVPLQFISLSASAK